MLSQANHWIDIAAAVIDALLLCRVLFLRLHRVYAFITLACLLDLFFDVVLLWLGTGSPESARVFLYSRFIYAFLFPAIAWDVFEEIKPQISKLRRLAMIRLISGLLLAAIFGLLVSAFADYEASAGASRVGAIAVVLWAASATASLAFLWTLHRGLRAQKIDRPNNTQVWLVFYELSFIGEVLVCFFSITAPLLHPGVVAILEMVFSAYGIAITGWCIVRLKALPSDVSSAPEKAKSS